MKVGYVQFRPRFGDKSYNLTKMTDLASYLDADVIVFPELATTGYVFKSEQELSILAEPADGPSIKYMSEFSKEKNVLVAFGFAERDGKTLYNSAAVITPEGETMIYRKVHLFNEEKRFFSRGNRFFTFSWKDVRFGVMICFDWIFPEAMRTLSLMGAQVVLHPANLVLPYCQDAMVTRCIENRVFTITANLMGVERGLKFTGRSQITAPGGVIVHRGLKTREEAFQVEIDPNEALNKRINLYNDLFQDRLPEAYRF
jgi:predicted amidohydrolase